MSNPEHIARAIDLMRRCGAHAHVPLMEAVQQGSIDLVLANHRNGSIPFGRLRQVIKPTCVLVGDDDDESSGPGGWRCAGQLAQWAVGALVHGAGAKTEHYQAAVAGTLSCGRFLLIDTSSRHAAEWAKLCPIGQTLVIVPPDGAQHPIISRPVVVH